MQIYAMIRFGVTPEINAMATIIMHCQLHPGAEPPSGSIAAGFPAREALAMNCCPQPRRKGRIGMLERATRKPAAKTQVKSGKAAKPRKKKVVAFFPEAAFGPALNSVGIAQAVSKLGHKVVFLSDPGFLEVYRAMVSRPIR